MLKQLIAACAFCLCGLTCAAADANKASLAELTEVKGIGPAIAGRIIEARQQGPFKNWEDLIARVSGIAAASAQKFSDGGLTINGQPLGKPTTTPPKDTKTNEKTGKPSNPS